MEDIDKEIEKFQAKRRRMEQQSDTNGHTGKVGLLSQGSYDKDLYGSATEGFVSSIASHDNDEDEDDMGATPPHSHYHATTDLVQEVAHAGDDHDRDPFKDTRRAKIIDRKDEYHLRQQRHNVISPNRFDPFLEGEYE
jgi:hypothetical protein